LYYLKKSEEGFVLVLSLLLLVIMTTIGAGLVFTASKQSAQSSSWANYQQAFYAAETGLEEARSWLDEKIYIEGIIPNEKTDETALCSKVFDVSKIKFVQTSNNDPGGVSENNKLKDIDNNINDGFKYSYYMEEADTTSGPNLGVGSEVTASNDESSNSKKTYKVYICGNGPNNEESNLEVLLSAIIGSG